MRKLWLLAFLFGLPAFAQSPVIGGAVQYVNTAPSGSCAAAPPIEVLISSGAIFTCDNGTWAQQTSGGGGSPGTVTSIATTGPITGGTITTTGTIACPTCLTSTSLPLAINFTFNSGASATDAAPRILAAHTATIANCYLLTTASDASTALTVNLFDNGSSIFSGGAQTVAAGTAAGTLTTLGALGTTAITNNDKISVNITSGTSSWIFSVQCK